MLTNAEWGFHVLCSRYETLSSPVLQHMLGFDSICSKQWILHSSAKPNLPTIITFSPALVFSLAGQKGLLSRHTADTRQIEKSNMKFVQHHVCFTLICNI